MFIIVPVHKQKDKKKQRGLWVHCSNKTKKQKTKQKNSQTKPVYFVVTGRHLTVWKLSCRDKEEVEHKSP